MDDQAPLIIGDPYVVRLRLVDTPAGRLVQLAMFKDWRDDQPDALPEQILNLGWDEAAQLGDWLKEYVRRALRPD